MQLLARLSTGIERVRSYLSSERIAVKPPYASTCDWFNNNKRLPGTDFRTWRDAEEVTLKTDFPDFGFNHLLMTSTSEQFPAAFAAVIPNARLWYSFWNPNAIFAPDGRPLADLTFRTYSMEGLYESMAKRAWRLPRHRFIPGSVADLTCLGDGRNYSHWLLDCLPKIHVLEQTGLMKQGYTFLVNARTQVVVDGLAVMGVRDSQILSLEETGPHVCCENLVAVSPLSSHYRPAWVFEFVRKRFGLADARPSELLFIGRKDAATRRVSNEEELLTTLRPLGFKSVTLTGMAIGQQARIFASAKGIVAAHGAGLSNLAFCQPNTPVLELFPEGYWSRAFWSISSMNNLRYGCLAFPGMSSNAKESDYRVDPSRVADAIKVLAFPV